MSKLAMKWVEAQRIQDGTVMAVLRSVAWFADKGTNECRKSHDEIAQHAGLGTRSVRYSLAILEKFSVIRRRARSRGKYGRTTDSVELSIDQAFDLSKADIVSMRKAVRASCKRHRVPLQVAHGARQYNQAYQEYPNQREGFSLGRDDSYSATGNVIALRPRGAR
jgi:predicted transcriptional regulator